MKYEKKIFLIIPMLLPFLSCAVFKNQKDNDSLKTVSYVDLNRYIGKWYEIARYDHRFQKKCANSMATYSFREDGKISVINECYEKSSGKLRKASGKAWVVDKKTNAKLKVSFFWPFSGDYWIIDLADNYEYAVVGHPSRKYLWILSRKLTMKDNLYKEILDRLKIQNYDISKLLKTSKGLNEFKKNEVWIKNGKD